MWWFRFFVPFLPCPFCPFRDEDCRKAEGRAFRAEEENQWLKQQAIEQGIELGGSIYVTGQKLNGKDTNSISQ